MSWEIEGELSERERATAEWRALGEKGEKRVVKRKGSERERMATDGDCRKSATGPPFTLV